MAVTAAPQLDITFGAPTIGPKVYVAKGPSGWPETFKRANADKELREFLQPNTIHDLVDSFIEARELDQDRKVTVWGDVVGYLSKLCGLPVRSIPHAIGVAFWAHIVIADATGIHAN